MYLFEAGYRPGSLFIQVEANGPKPGGIQRMGAHCVSPPHFALRLTWPPVYTRSVKLEGLADLQLNRKVKRDDYAYVLD